MTSFADISTLLGLLGTIMGLITAFQGVTAAIPCLSGYYMLNNRGDYLIDKMEEKSVSMANLLSMLKKIRK